MVIVDEESLPAVCNDPARLAALRTYGMLDTPPDAEFDDITRIIAHICQVPIALISLVDSNRQFFKSKFGLDVNETPLNVSICARSLQESGLVVVPDASKDPRFSQNPLVSGDPHLRFYAGAPLQTPEGQQIGRLCVLDYVERQLTPAQLDALQVLARQVMSQMELRRTLAAQAAVMAERQKIKDELERSMQAKDQFFAELSHELRTPLNPVLMTITALEKDARLPESLREDIEIIRRNVDLEVRLIDDLLDLTRISRRKVELKLTTVNAQQALRETLHMCASDVTAKHQTCVSQIGAIQDNLNADPARLHQIFANLIRNAIKFTPEGGTITVRTGNASEGRWMLSIQDTGIGIDPSRLPTVFNAYEQGDRSITRRFGGLGLGLAITKALVEIQGGTIIASSEGLGQGSTFTVSFPTTKTLTPAASEGLQAAPLDEIPKPSARRKILLVEDNDVTARVMARLLRQMKHEVSTACDIAAAIHAADNQPFDLLISDVGLPDGSGLDLIRELQQRYAITGIAVTGYGMEEDIRSCYEAGFRVHLTKPISAAQLEAAIDQINS